MARLKRLLAKNNYIRELSPLQEVQTLFELDLESNGVDSHIDFLKFIKGKNDLIIVNLHQNPLMVEIHSIEKFNEALMQNAPDYVTQTTNIEIQELKEVADGD
jgi:CMP-2-keto-3-deoxyoctulosonic acid synthetase